MKVRKYIQKSWGSIANYMGFYQEWVTTCATINRCAENPNRVKARRWAKRNG